jgi:hypothetical protein
VIVSHATGKRVAVIAVPIHSDQNGSLIGNMDGCIRL